MRDNASLSCSQIIYNLAFSPMITHIDLTNNNSSSSIDAVIEALYKLLKISGSIKTLLLSGTGIVKKITKEFASAIGECKTLEHLNLDEKILTTV
jgi:hypothetical protein